MGEEHREVEVSSSMSFGTESFTKFRVSNQCSYVDPS